MTKAAPSLTSISEPGLAPCTQRRASTFAAASTTTTSFSPRRFFLRQPSFLAAAIPYLRRLDPDPSAAATSDDIACTHLKAPLLTLKLSSVSFLDATVHDSLSERPLYSVETVGAATTVYRSDPWEGSVRTADIRWPIRSLTRSSRKDRDDVLVQINGAPWRTGSEVLKTNPLISGRKFSVPGYSHSLKWKRIGIAYQCTSASIKGPIATLDPAVGTVPPILFVYETVHDRYGIRPLFDHAGVSIVMLDRLIVTAILLVTEVYEWENLAKPTLAWRFPSISDSPLFSTRSRQLDSPRDDSLYNKAVPPTPSLTEDTSPSSERWASIDYGDPLRSTTSVTPFVLGKESKLSLPPSPTAESLFYPLTNASLPSHIYLDTSFHGSNNNNDEEDIPPVPKIPMQYRSASTRSLSYQSFGSSHHRRPRELPTPPSQPACSPESSQQQQQQPLPRSRSTPPPRRIELPSPTHPRLLRQSSSAPIASHRSNSLRSASTSGLPHRRLPQPPSSSSSSSRMAAKPHSLSVSIPALGEKGGRPLYSARSLPPTPVAATSSASSSSSYHPSVAVAGAYSEKEDKELGDWIRLLTSHHPVEIRKTRFDFPPPAYAAAIGTLDG